jgi:Ca-activated chloride channel family protein
VDYLLSEIRKTEQPEKELVDEVTYLAKRYGIVTPYTAYLMTDDVVGKDQAELAARFNNRFGGLAGGGGLGLAESLPGAPADPSATAPPANEPAQQQAQVRAAKALGDARRARDESGAADALYELADRELQTESKRDGKNAMHALRYIGSRTFYQSEGVWYDSEFNPAKDKAEKTIKVGSEDYLSLIKSDKAIVKYLALGNVIVKVKDKWYRFEI